jgi:hypothetical protein
VAITFDKIFPSQQTEAEVSSQEDSIARILMGILFIFL